MPNSPAKQPRTAFVTTAAWIILVISCLMAVNLLFQLVIMFTFPEFFLLGQALGNDARSISGGLLFLMRYAHWILLGVFVLHVAVCVCAVAMLRRKKWGRTGVIAALMCTIVLSLIAAARELTNRSPDTTSIAVTLICCSLFFWICLRLMSVKVHAEFS